MTKFTLSLVNSLSSLAKSGILMVITYQLKILVVKVGQADDKMHNLL